MLGKKDVQDVPRETIEQKEKKDKGETRYLRVRLPLKLHKEIRKRAIDVDKSVHDYVVDIPNR
jgi:hypothetical protein